MQIDVQAVAYQLPAVAAELGDQQVRTDVASLVLEAYEDERERDPDVLVGVVRALSSAQDPRGLPVLTALAAHPDAGVRFQVAADLPMIMGGPPEPDGVTALIALTADPDPQIRGSSGTRSTPRCRDTPVRCRSLVTAIGRYADLRGRGTPQGPRVATAVAKVRRRRGRRARCDRNVRPGWLGWVRGGDSLTQR
ncbi:HEAT repeat domain-containing protein [Hamadaea sp. NPDC050747]|uniref:HEAT repeat domain-containing protein n=1 Tax=Hamadaea sp. NPDC050747 TaxID=3155789 RepID=UPI003404CE07